MTTARDTGGSDLRPARHRGRRSLASIGAVLALGGAMIISTQGAASALVPLSVEAGADETLAEGSALNRTIAFVDEVDDGAPGWNYSVDYGDGTVGAGASTLTPSITLSHVDADGPALRTVRVVVIDDAESALDSFVVTVTNVSPTPVTETPAPPRARPTP